MSEELYMFLWAYTVSETKADSRFAAKFPLGNGWLPNVQSGFGTKPFSSVSCLEAAFVRISFQLWWRCHMCYHHVTNTTGIYVLTHARWTILLHGTKSVSTIKGTISKNGLPVTPSLYIVSVLVKIWPLIYGYCELTFWTTFTLTDQHDRTYHNIWIFLCWSLSVCSPSSAVTVQTAWRCLNMPQYTCINVPHYRECRGVHVSVCHIIDNAEVYMYQCATLQRVQGCTCISVSHYRQCRCVHVSMCHITDSTGVYMYQCVTLQTAQKCICISVSYYRQCRGVHVLVCHITDSAGVCTYQCVTL
jgi:hypothetical protein